MRYLSLFSGIGGFDIAFTGVGMECEGMVEIDKNCQDVLKHNFPGVNIYNDVKEVGIGTHERGSVDIICGGFPCQDLSIAGKRAGLTGERSGLWYEFARIIDELEPGWVVIENVPGILSSGKGSDFAIVIRWLAERGYGVVWRVLDAQYFGVPQRRRRVFVVASFGNGSSAEVLFESEGMFGDIAKSGQEGKEVANTIAEGSNKCHSDITSGQQDGNLITPSIVSNGDAHSGFRDTGGLVAATLEAGYFTIVSRPLRTQSQLAHREDVDTLVMTHSQAKAEIVRDGSPSLTCRHEAPIVATSWTLRGGKEGGGKGYLGSEELGMTLGGQPQYMGIRRLTPTECARLQGFPDDWNDWLSDSARYRQFGNAVAVPVVRWIAERILLCQ